MKREIIETKDGSKTIHLKDWNENYHSHHGALHEAQHVFIRSGLELVAKECRDIRILEVGLGTGLNAFLTCDFARVNSMAIEYHGLEAFPIREEEFAALNYSQLVEQKDDLNAIESIFYSDWGKMNIIHNKFKIWKYLIKIQDYTFPEDFFQLVYFDAFGPRVQPEMWTEGIFELIYKSMTKGGVFVTYCAKGDVRRALMKVGFEVEKIPGPPGKREMLRARK
jgi:tRNA U34 5-methylaminomethyl-2-thiouridine-forming methyltransferase MnmC